MTYQHVVIDRQENVAVLTINRPEKYNALNREVIGDISTAVDELTADNGVGAIIITGAGDKAFVSGADIEMMRDLESPPDGVATSRQSQGLTLKIEKLPKPVIAALNGYTLGGGLELAMACDIRIAADTAKLGQPEINLGLIPGSGGSQRLPRLVGKGMAKLLIFSGQMIGAEEALRIGLVEKVVPLSELMKEATALAKTLATKSPLALRMAKEVVNLGVELDLERALSLESLEFGVVCVSEDCKEGCSAFLEKREPMFKGR
ncbi:MAG TPA: enoyl-CoA hydratase-related protein [Anaerolineae bacterium]|nr:enoyl-CoA hydratase-related protein [Anaerolineae bacterium]